jgi:ABC-2 type transport system permease protein
MMGLVMVKINPGFKDVLMPAMIIMVALSSTILGLPGPLVEGRDAGVYRSFKINGVPALSILAFPALSTIFHALIVSAIIALTAGTLFGGATPTNWVALILLTLLVVFTYGAFGTLIGVVATNSRSVMFLTQALFLPSMLLGGMMVPINILPESVRPIAMILPTSHMMQAFTGLAFSQQTVVDPVRSVIFIAVSGLLAIGLAAYLFNWDSRNNTRRGHPLMGLLVMAPYLISIILK